MAKVQLYPPKIMQKVNEILPLYGDSNFADILNRLWMNGAPVEKLQKALLDDPGVGNTPSDIMAALISQGIVTEQQLREGASSYVPPDSVKQPWPFRPENTNPQGIVIPVFMDPATKIYPDAPRPTPIPEVAPGGPGTRPPISTVQGPAGEKKPKAPRTEAEIEKYQRDHFGNMLWVKNDPELKGLLRTAATEQWTPERFRAEFENSGWWKNNKDSVRKFIERSHTDAATLNSEIDTKVKTLLAQSEQLGLSFTYQDLLPLATDSIKLGWDDLQLKQNLMAKVQYDPERGGGLGAFATNAKKMGKDYLINMTDQEAFEWSKKLFTGEATEANIQESLATRAKASYPSIADFIESGMGTPKSYFGQHIATAAQLLEIDPETVDLTDQNFNQIISYADDKGNIRPMSVQETSRLITQKDEYWKTSNSANEVTGILNTLGTVFGKTAF